MDKIEKKIADGYNAKHSGGQQPAAQPAPQQQQPAPQQEQHHGKNIAKKLGNAATFGAGATAGSDAVNGIINNV